MKACDESSVRNDVTGSFFFIPSLLSNAGIIGTFAPNLIRFTQYAYDCWKLAFDEIFQTRMAASRSTQQKGLVIV